MKLGTQHKQLLKVIYYSQNKAYTIPFFVMISACLLTNQLKLTNTSCFHTQKHFVFRKLLSTNGYVEVKQRAGCLSYMEDKLGYHSELARTLTQSETVPWDPPAKAIVSFTSESTLRNFCDNYLTCGNQSGGFDEERLQQIFTRVTYECVVKDKLVAIPIFAGLFKVS